MSRQSDIWEYLQGERTGKRANRFEREMLSDPFLYEAVEGLTTVKADHEKIVQQLQKRMKKREGNKTVRLYRCICKPGERLIRTSAYFTDQQPENQTSGRCLKGRPDGKSKNYLH